MRPRTLFDVAKLAAGTENYPSYLKEFLDEFRVVSSQGDPILVLDCISQEPQSVSLIHDVHIAGIAEYIAFAHKIPCPAWADAPTRVLNAPVFFGGRHSRDLLLSTTTFSMRKRNLFCGKVEL